MYYGIESRPPLVENNILDYALSKSLNENDFKSKKPLKRYNLVNSKKYIAVKKIMKQKKTGFGCPSHLLELPNNVELHKVAEYLKEYINYDEFVNYNWNNKRQSQMVKTISSLIT